MRLAINVPSGNVTQFNNQALMLNWTPEVVLDQPLASACWKINPYQSFTFERAVLSISPSSDFWTEFDTVWASPVTRQIAKGSSETDKTQVVDQDRNLIPFLRQIPITYTLKGFWPGETLTSLTFAGINVTPSVPPVASALGEITGSFTIPAKIKAGTKRLQAVGSLQSKASTLFVGQGTVEITTRRKVNAVAIPFFSSGNSGQHGAAGPDPLAQSFNLLESRFICAVDLQFCAKGNPTVPVIVEIVEMENNAFPSTRVLGQSIVNMANVALNANTRCFLQTPVFIPRGLNYAVKVKTNDPGHSVHVAELGQRDFATNRGISSQPYTVGVLFSSSNDLSWTIHQGLDLTFKLVACKFAPTTKTVVLGNVGVTQCSDMLIMAAVEIANNDASAYFQVKRGNGTIRKLLPGQWDALAEFLTEPLEVSVVLSGSEHISPVIYPGVSFVYGTLQSTATYESVALPLGSPAKLLSRIRGKIPAGATIAVDYETNTPGVYAALTTLGTEALKEGFTEYKYQKNPFTQTTSRMRVTLTGSPAARPVASDFRAYTI